MKASEGLMACLPLLANRTGSGDLSVYAQQLQVSNCRDYMPCICSQIEMLFLCSGRMSAPGYSLRRLHTLTGFISRGREGSLPGRTPCRTPGLSALVLSAAAGGGLKYPLYHGATGWSSRLCSQPLNEGQANDGGAASHKGVAMMVLGRRLSVLRDRPHDPPNRVTSCQPPPHSLSSGHTRGPRVRQATRDLPGG